MAKQVKREVKDKATLMWEMKQKRVIEALNAVLAEEGVVLQPFIQYTETGIMPGLRLIKAQPAPAKATEDDEKETSK